MDSNGDIAHESLPFIRVYKDGRVERLLRTPIVPPSIDPQTGVSSKDVFFKPDGAISARLYLPELTKNSLKLPILVYFHGGGFVYESAFSPMYHNYLNSLVSEANVVAISVEYRRAPEHPLPTAYDDSWAALQWVASHADSSVQDPELWLTEHADFERIFVSGDSAGANIAHNMAIRAGVNGLNHGASIHGVVLIHPYFWGSTVIGCELSDLFVKALTDNLWACVCPTSSSAEDTRDHPLINPVAPGAPCLSGIGCSRMLVCVAEKDVLRDRGRAYYDALKKSSWRGVAVMMETKGENHVFHLLNPGCEKAVEMMERLVSFFNDDKGYTNTFSEQLLDCALQ